MEWTWITFSLISLAFCGLAVLIARSIRPTDMQVNQLEIIDIDSIGNTIQGNIWTNIYSPTNVKCDVSPESTNGLGIDTTASSICWMGRPGDGLGGMRSATVANLFEPGYGCELATLNGGAGIRSRLTGLPIRVSATRTLFTQYQAPSRFDVRHRLRLNVARNRLNGTVTNPLDVDLRDCRLIFENWAYILTQPLLAGETIDVYAEMKERTSTFYFSRRQEGEDKAGGRPWNSRDDDLDRIAEMIMFHESAHGRQYTGMTHAFQPFVDLSEHVDLQRAVLYGKVAGVCTRLNIESEQSDVSYDQCNTYVRIVLPVEVN